MPSWKDREETELLIETNRFEEIYTWISNYSLPYINDFHIEIEGQPRKMDKKL